MLAADGAVYTVGSNEYGQLGVKNQQLPHFYEHPLTLGRTYYTETPKRVDYFNQAAIVTSTYKPQAEASPVVAIAAGDCFSLALTMGGRIFAWGLQADGRLGTGKVHKAGFATVPEPVVFPEDNAKTTKNIESLHSRGALSYALVSTIKSDGSSKVGDQTYLWGKVPAGLNMKLHGQTLATPEVLEEIAPYSFG